MKKIIFNIFLLVVTYFAPLYYQHLHQNDLGDFRFMQNSLMATVFIGAITLTYLNHKFRKQAVSQKWIWVIFEIIGILGVLYAGGILLILFSFRHGIGF